MSTKVVGMLAMLEEDSEALQTYALRALNELVRSEWISMVRVLPRIEELAESTNFKGRDIACLLASRLLYHMGELSDSLEFATMHQPMSVSGPYTSTIISSAVESYILGKKSSTSLGGSVIRQSKTNEQYNSILGISLATEDVKEMENILKTSANTLEIISYILRADQNGFLANDFRKNVLKLVISTLKLQTPEIQSYWLRQLLSAYYAIWDSNSVAKWLTDILLQDPILASQLAFDIVALEDATFQTAVMTELAMSSTPPSDLDTKRTDNDHEEKTTNKNLEYIHKILSGRISLELNLLFLHTRSKTDLIFLDNIRIDIEHRNLVLRYSIVLCHALLQSGTANDTFMRRHTEWLSKTSGWAKFSAVACFGVIHRGQIQDAATLLQAYIPSTGSVNASPYIQGGSLLALGIIHANTGDELLAKYISDELKCCKKSEVSDHAASIGMGLVMLGRKNERVYSLMKDILFHDVAIAGEGAALGMGLVMFGSQDASCIEQLLLSSQDTQHEKIIRACGISVAFVLLGSGVKSRDVQMKLLKHDEEYIRYGGVFSVGLAYVNSGDRNAVCTLLNSALTDSSDSVRRGAAISLAFVLCNDSSAFLVLGKLMCESYDPHVRYGSALAVGMVCAGTGDNDAIAALWPLLKDNVDFVQQGALFGLAMVLQLQNEKTCSAVTALKAVIRSLCTTKSNDILVRFGAAIALGILDAGGKNVKCSFFSDGNCLRKETVVGYVLFAQIWFWFPLATLLCLAFKPEMCIGVNSVLQVPKDWSCTATASNKFIYSANVRATKNDNKKSTIKAILNSASRKITLERRKRMAHKHKKKEKVADDTPLKLSSPVLDLKAPTPNPFILHNPFRVLQTQIPFIKSGTEQRFTPLLPLRKKGVILLVDSKPNLPCQSLALKKENSHQPQENDDDYIKPFTPFKWDGPAPLPPAPSAPTPPSPPS